MALATTKATGQIIKPPLICYYGVGGIGKTSLAAQAPKPKFICTEEGRGLLSFDAFRFVDSGDINATESNIATSWQDILDAVAWLYVEQHDYQTVVLDTLDRAEPLLWRHTAHKHGKSDIEAFGYGKGYMFAAEEANTLLEGLRALRNERNMTVIVLAHSDVKRFESPDHEPYDRFKMRVHDRFANLVHDWADAMLFANWRVHVVKDADKFDKTKGTARGVGVGERVIYTEERPAFYAKNRYNLPPEITLPRDRTQAWATLQNAIVAGIQSSQTQPEGQAPQTQGN